MNTDRKRGNKLDQVVAGAQRQAMLREQDYRAKALTSIVKLRRIYPFCGRNPSAPKREINDLEVAEQSLNRVKQLNLTIPYGIHKSRVIERWLAENPKFQFLFQPTYYPWVNIIERLWKSMHDTVTLNHRCRSMYELCQSVARFLEVVQPFPGNGHGVALLRSAI